SLTHASGKVALGLAATAVESSITFTPYPVRGLQYFAGWERKMPTLCRYLLRDEQRAPEGRRRSSCRRPASSRRSTYPPSARQSLPSTADCRRRSSAAPRRAAARPARFVLSSTPRGEASRS